MKQKQLLILLILVVALGAVGYYLRNQQANSNTGNRAMGQKLFPNLPINDVTQISIKHGADETTLAKKDNLWRVRDRNDYPANFADISDFLIKAKDIKIVQAETVGASHLDRFALAPGQGSNAPTIVDLRDKDAKLVKSFSLGKKHMKKSDRPSPFGDTGEEGFPDGRYVKLNDSDSVALVSEPFSNIEPKPDQWLNKDFFKVEKIRSVETTFPTATNSWKVSRDTESGEWKLAGAKPDEKIDSGKTSGLGNALSSPSFSDVVVNLKPEQLGLDKPTSVTIGTFDNFTYTLKVGQKTNDNYPLTLTVAADIAKERTPGKDEKKEDKDKLDKEFKDKQKKLEEKLTQEKGYEKWVYLVSSWSLEPVLKERSGILADKKDEKKDGAKKDDAAEADKSDEAPVVAPPSAPAATAPVNTNAPAASAAPGAAPAAPAATNTAPVAPPAPSAPK